MHAIVKTISHYVVYFAEVAAALIILIGAVQALWIFLKAVFTRKQCFEYLNQSRLKIGYSLSLGLGFLVGADVIQTAITPSWNEIGILGAVVVIRIVLNYFLMRDLKEYESSHQDDPDC